MIRITENLNLSTDEIIEEFCCSGGPGGQNVNKVSTAVRLRFHIASSSLPESIKSKIFSKLATRINTLGELIVECRVHRTQLQNRQEAFEKFANIIRGALIRKPKRINTKPTRASKQRRLDAKKQHAATKKLRGEKFD